MGRKVVNLSAVKHKGLLWLLVRCAVIVSFILCIVSIISNQSDIAQMKKQLHTVNQKTEALEAENIEYERLLNNNDINTYMEKMAIENLNYAYPNELRFYDTSRN